MSAYPRPRRLHLLGLNARIYIVQECTTRGSRCLHLLVQEHNPRHACTKKIHTPQLACAKGCMHFSFVRVQKMPVPASYARSKDTRAASSYACVKDMHAPLRASKTCTRHPLPACAKDDRA